MAKYELALVVNARIEDEKRVAVVKRAQGYIERFGGKVGATEEWGKKRLAYEIQKMHEGYYYFIKFEGQPNTPNDLEQNMRIMDNVLRYLIVRLDDEAEIGEPNETDVKTEEAAEEAEEAAETEEAPAEEAEAPAEEAAEEAPAEEAPAAEEAE
ncbi:MAG: 30S ribosomal protein S6 [Lachnospiraceae bacterium]|nr:30S ribosomal protein S6 [Lachnospiraceae bacterium]